MMTYCDEDIAFSYKSIDYINKANKPAPSARALADNVAAPLPEY